MNGDYNGEENEQTSYWKVKLSKWPIPSCCPSATTSYTLSAALYKKWLFGNTRAASVQLTELHINLYKLAWVLRLYSVFILPNAMLLQFPPHIINVTIHKKKRKSESLSVHFIYDISFYFAVVRFCPFLMSPLSSQEHFTCIWFSVFI